MDKHTEPAVGAAGRQGITFDQQNDPANITTARHAASPSPATRALRAVIIGSKQAEANGVTARGHSPVLALCRALIEAGVDPKAPLEVYRGTTLCLRVRSIDEGAALSVEDDENGRPRFVRHRLRTCGAAPYVTQAVRPVP
jgi:hypothetical protein